MIGEANWIEMLHHLKNCMHSFLLSTKCRNLMSNTKIPPKCCFVSDSGVLLLKCVPDHNNRINQPVGLAFTMIKGVALAYPDGSFLDTANFKIARLAHNCFYMMHDATIGK